MPTPELAFAERFADFWKRPDPARLDGVLAPDVVLLQPHLPPIRGLAAAKEEFTRMLRWMPGLHGIVDRASGSDGVVFIEWRLVFQISGRDVPVGAVDRFLLRDGLGVERKVFFDQVPLYAAVATSPSSWAGFLRYRFGPATTSDR